MTEENVSHAPRQVGVVVVGRPTFDLPSATTLVADAVAGLSRRFGDVRGSTEPATTVEAVRSATAAWSNPDVVVVVFASFADSTLAATALEPFPNALAVLWAFPEQRTGGRLRRNSMCGANLVGYRLGRADRPVIGLYGTADDPTVASRLDAVVAARESADRPPRLADAGQLAALIARPALMAPSTVGPTGDARAATAVARLTGARIGIIGEPPQGFEPCAVEPELAQLPIVIDHVSMDALFQASNSVPVSMGTPVRIASAAAALRGIEQVDATSTSRSMQLHGGLQDMVRTQHWDATAIRCWPECFDEWGAAVCGPMSLLADEGTPAACEADAGGAITSLLLSAVSGRAPFLADVVDIDRADDTVVVWHCGVAPVSMAGTRDPARASTHPNRGLALTVDFALAPGTVTVARISQSRGVLRLIVGTGTVLDRPKAFAGTSGVLRLGIDAGDLFDLIIAEGLEHHLGVVPGDHRDALLEVARSFGLPVVDLSRGSP